MTSERLVAELDKGVSIIALARDDGIHDLGVSYQVVQKQDNVERELDQFDEMQKARIWAKGYIRGTTFKEGHQVESEDTIVVTDSELGERLLVTPSEDGVFIDHNWFEGAIFISVDELVELNRSVEELMDKTNTEEGQ